ncbi:DEAD/DEAH box helicase [Candidatus Woesearchaeota archaeon]|nr:DEAD/DEAH box helicase [Candidatus Woesearchaeota archaeon]
MVNIKNFTPRLYQETIMASCAKGNCLIILPTGLGKTKTAIMAAVQRLNSFPNSKILFLTVTKPLAEQICNEVKECVDLDENKIALFTGSVAPAKRGEFWKNAVVTVSTPQCIENDIINGRISLEDVSLLIADEAHNAVKDYAYTWVAKQYHKKSNFPRIIGLTASPGSDLEKIQEVCKNLYIEEIEIRTDKDPDVRPYVHEIEIDWVKVELPKVFLEVRKYLQDFLNERLEKLKKWGILRRTDLKYVNKTDLLNLQAQLRGRASTGEKDFVLWNAISVLAEIMKVSHGLELLETQGIIPLYKYMDRFNNDAGTTKVKAVKNIVKDLNFRSAFIKVSRLYEEKAEHPKLIELQKIAESDIKGNRDNKIIVFNQYRDNAVDVVEKLNSIENVNAKLFVGQLKKGETGLSQKEQKAVLDEFREGKFNVLVATSIGEQGLDIPQVDTVVFYEPIPSAIRQIQRRGRTGRHGKGRVIVLVTKDTMDEGFRWAAHHKEKRMYRNLDNLKKKLTLFLNSKDEKITKYVGDKVKIFADYREKGSGIIKELVELDADLKLDALQADYILSSRVGVELKTSEDFVQSIIDGRLLQQIKNLKSNFERPLLVIEGVEDIYSVRNVHANSIRGMLAAIAVSYGVPILYTKNFKDTAQLLSIIAKREQEDTGKDFSLHPEKKNLSIREQQEYIISSLPGVGSGLAKPLLKYFKSVKNVVNAEQKELEKVEKIGKKKAERIKDIVDREYQSL